MGDDDQPCRQPHVVASDLRLVGCSVFCDSSNEADVALSPERILDEREEYVLVGVNCVSLGEYAML